MLSHSHSTRHTEVHPSPECALPSSHSSHVSSTPLPQVKREEDEEEDEDEELEDDEEETLLDELELLELEEEEEEEELTLELLLLLLLWLLDEDEEDEEDELLLLDDEETLDDEDEGVAASSLLSGPSTLFTRVPSGSMATVMLSGDAEFAVSTVPISIHMMMTAAPRRTVLL
uniref:Uncharacterized protein n=2 Tax=Hemiselmis andersenii TaxID=464988 RepID=A0A7S1DTT9_HEMAN|mmetsp:Transcript_27587/g.67222  ORF Transcript_27587/g.67222 Transcript_27587/m.67222 type:complete len:173 (+) Transcript_27587:119-637(+)